MKPAKTPNQDGKNLLIGLAIAFAVSALIWTLIIYGIYSF